MSVTALDEREQNVIDWVDGLKWEGVPVHCQQGLKDWLLIGQPPGDFLWAVLNDRLVEAFIRADHINTLAMAEYVRFLHWEMPGLSWHPANVDKWIAQGGLLKRGREA